MEKQNKTWRRKVRSLVGALFLGIASVSRGEDFTYGPVTNNTTLVPKESIEYLVQASSAGNGYVTGNINDWIESGSNVNLTAVADAHYKFLNWSGVPTGTSTNNPLRFFAEGVYTNIVANFVAKTNLVEDIGISSIKPNGDKIDLTITNTYTNSDYYILSSTNLLLDNWLSETNNVGNGKDLIFNLSTDSDRKFYRGKRYWEE